MNVALKPAENYEYVNNLFQYYIYDMSEYTGFQPYENGTFQVSDSITGLSDYWNKPHHFPYLILVDNEIAGFSLVRKYPDDESFSTWGSFLLCENSKVKGLVRKRLN